MPPYTAAVNQRRKARQKPVDRNAGPSPSSSIGHGFNKNAVERWSHGYAALHCPYGVISGEHILCIIPYIVIGPAKQYLMIFYSIQYNHIIYRYHCVHHRVRFGFSDNVSTGLFVTFFFFFFFERVKKGLFTFSSL